MIVLPFGLSRAIWRNNCTAEHYRCRWWRYGESKWIGEVSARQKEPPLSLGNEYPLQSNIEFMEVDWSSMRRRNPPLFEITCIARLSLISE